MNKKFAPILILLFIVFFHTAAAETIVLPGRLEEIDPSAFEGDSSLDRAELPDGILWIKSKAFAYSSLQNINLPESLIFIANDAFEGTNTSFDYTEGTYAHQWVQDHEIDFSFDDPYAYNYETIFAFFEDDPSIGLFHENWIRNYQIANYDDVRQNKHGEPQWNVEIVGDTYGVEINYSIGTWAGDGSRAIDVFFENTPSEICTLHYRVSCTWDSKTIIADGSVNYVEAALPVGNDAPDEYHMKVNEPYELNVHLLPEGYKFGDFEWTDLLSDMPFDSYTDYRNGENIQIIIPRYAGTFYGELVKKHNNIQTRKYVTIYVEDVNGDVPPAAPEIHLSAGNNPGTMVLFERNDEIGLTKTYEGWLSSIYIENYYLLQHFLGGTPEWHIEGNTRLRGKYNEEDGTFDVYLIDYPDDPGTEAYTVKCNWGGYEAESIGEIIFRNDVDLPTGSNIPDEVEMTVGQWTSLELSFEPADFLPNGNHFASVDELSCDHSWYAEGHTLFIEPYEAGIFTGWVNVITDNVVIYKEVLFRVSDEEGSVPAPIPVFSEEIHWNMSLPFEDNKGYDIYVSTYTDLTVENWNTLSYLYGDDVSWTFESLSDVEIDIDWQPRENYFSFYFNNLFEMEEGADIPVSATLRWGESTASSVFHFHIIRIELPDCINFEPDFRMNVWEPYYAEVSFEPADWYDDYFLFYDFEDESNFDKWGEEKNIFCIRALNTGVYGARPHIHASNVFIYGKWIDIIVGNNSAIDEAHRNMELIRNFDFDSFDSLYIPENMFTYMTIDGITDIEEIEKINHYNAAIDEILPRVAQYNQVISQAYAVIDEINDQYNMSYIIDDNGALSVDSNIIKISVNGNSNDTFWNDMTIDDITIIGNDDAFQEKSIYASGDATSEQETSQSEPVQENNRIIIEIQGEGVDLEELFEWLKRNALDFSNFLDLAQIILNEIMYYDIVIYNSPWYILGNLDTILSWLSYLTGMIDDIPDVYLDGLEQNKINNLTSYHGHLTPFEKAEPYSLKIFNEMEKEIAYANRLLWAERSMKSATSLISAFSLYGAVKRVNIPIDVKQTSSIASIGLNTLSNDTREKAFTSINKIQRLDAELHYEITGVVNDNKGNVLSNVEVTSGNVLTFTDALGIYTLEVPYSRAILHFEKDQYKTPPDQIVADITPYLPKRFDMELEEEIDHGYVFGKITDRDTKLPIEGAVVSYENISVSSSETGNYFLAIPMEIEELTRSVKIHYTKDSYISGISELIIEKNKSTEDNKELDSCFLIRNRQDLENVANNTSANYSLANDINLNGEPWIPLPWFSGILDGQGHSINGMSITETNGGNAGLFAGLLGAEIRNLNISGASIVVPVDSSFSTSGILCGQMNANQDGDASSVTNSGFSGSITVSDGTVNGQVFVGGVTGLANYGSISGCAVNVNINVNYQNNMNVGGVVGQMRSGSLSNTDFSGALQGYQTNGNASAQIWVSGLGYLGGIYPLNCNVSGSVEAVGINAYVIAHGLDNTQHGTNNASVYAFSSGGAASAIGCENCYSVINNGSVSAASWQQDANATGLDATVSSVNNGYISAASEYGEANAIAYTGAPGGNTDNGSWSSSSTYNNHYAGSVEWIYTQH